ncbi:hypothetical protein B0H14DRAFT_3127378 [Mycena olivaceomarginata]|nr:hypothetical protein B0H14DRAFT_3127378 [Mycena olivaceomarginata]
MKECLELLKRQSELDEMLKRAHADESYNLVRASVFIRKPFPKKAQELLDKLRPSLATYIRDTEPIGPWHSHPQPTDPALLAHMESLGLLSPEINGLPSMILKDLGSFTNDPVLSSRVRNLFVRGKKTVMVNTSGSGKTRLLLEGLCNNWGLYFLILNPGVRDLGSVDFRGVVEDVARFSNAPASEDSARNFESNLSCAEERLGEASLHVFLRPQKNMANSSTFAWIIGPQRHFSVVDALSSRLRRSMRYPETFDNICELMGSDFHLFLVLDEGQAAATGKDSLPRAFHAEPGKYPFLLKILETWDERLPVDSFSYAIAGTDIPNLFSKISSSFDDQTPHERYLRRFLPPSLLATQLGEDFLQQLLMWNFQRPHNALDDYIAKATQFQPTDGEKWAEFESSSPDLIVPVTRPKVEPHVFSQLLDYNETESTLREAIFHYLATDKRLPRLKVDKIETVSLGFGSFVDGGMNEITLDEPMVLAGMASWMTKKHPTDKQQLDSYLDCLQQSPPTTAKAFSACLAFYFSPWAKHPVELVGLHTTTGTVTPLATGVSSLEDVVSWMEHARPTPFCIPAAEASTPDLLFVLKLKNGAYLWVVMQLTPTKSNGSDLLKSLEEAHLFCDADHNADSALHTRAIELLNAPPAKGGPSTRSAPTVLRVVAAFDTQFNLKNPKKGKGKAHPVHASLSMDMFHTIAAELKPADFVQSVVANVLKRKLEAVDDEQSEEGGREAKRRSSTLSKSREKLTRYDSRAEEEGA